MNTNKDMAEKKILDDIDNYKLTLGSMCALAYVLEKYYDAESRIAPAMDPSNRNQIQTTNSVTPDMVSQGSEIDLVVEVKRSLPDSIGGQSTFLNQIRKYDDDLTGWSREPLTHDIIILTHITKSARWADFLTTALKEKKVTFSRKVSIIVLLK